MDLNDRIAFEIKHRFYYVEYPDGVPEPLWKDGHGEFQYISEMSLDHLKASVTRIENDLKAFRSSYDHSSEWDELSTALLPLVENKLRDLKDAFSKKARL